MNKNKAKRKEKVIGGWTRKSHKGAKIYFQSKKKLKASEIFE